MTGHTTPWDRIKAGLRDWPVPRQRPGKVPGGLISSIHEHDLWFKESVLTDTRPTTISENDVRDASELASGFPWNASGSTRAGAGTFGVWDGLVVTMDGTRGPLPRLVQTTATVTMENISPLAGAMDIGGLRLPCLKGDE